MSIFWCCRSSISSANRSLPMLSFISSRPCAATKTLQSTHWPTYIIVPLGDFFPRKLWVTFHWEDQPQQTCLLTCLLTHLLYWWISFYLFFFLDRILSKQHFSTDCQMVNMHTPAAHKTLSRHPVWRTRCCAPKGSSVCDLLCNVKFVDWLHNMMA